MESAPDAKNEFDPNELGITINVGRFEEILANIDATIGSAHTRGKVGIEMRPALERAQDAFRIFKEAEANLLRAAEDLKSEGELDAKRFADGLAAGSI